MCRCPRPSLLRTTHNAAPRSFPLIYQLLTLFVQALGPDVGAEDLEGTVDWNESVVTF